MNSFGILKSKVERLFESSYGKPEFKNHIKTFKSLVLEKKEMCEIYYIYDDLSSNKGLNKDIVDDYISESLEKLKKLIDKNNKNIDLLDSWVNNVVSENTNNYSEIDSQIYTKNVTKNLENLLESKNKIKKVLLKKKIDTLNEGTIDIPISSMLQIATKTFNNEFSSLNEEEKKEFKEFISLDKAELKEEIDTTKTKIKDKLNLNLQESNDNELIETIQKTITKINETDYTLSSLYKLKQLEKGLI